MASGPTISPWVFIVVGVGGVVLVLFVVWIICKCRQRNQIDYTALDEERSLLQKWEDEKRMKKNTERDAVLLNCYFYLKNSSSYSFINNLPDIGSCMNRHWFLVQDSHTRSQNLLSMTQWSQQCILPCNTQTKRTLSELFKLLSSHPFIFPVQSVDLISDQRSLVLIQPFIEGGSLKDIIYGSHPKSAWFDKYEVKGKHLSEAKIKDYGRQILEALIYLQNKGLPHNLHVHSGNVFIVDRVCKVSGYEATLLGYKSRLEATIKGLTKNNDEYFEVISFGHLLCEMSAGVELKANEPDQEYLSKCRSEQVIEVLKGIFDNESGSFPCLEEIACLPFFKHANVTHLQRLKKIKFSASIKTLIRLYRKDEEETSQSRRRKRERKKSRGESMVDSKRARTKSRSKSTKKSPENVPESVVLFKQAQSPPIPPPPVFSSLPPPPQPPPATNVSRPEVKFEKPRASSERASLLSDIRKGSNLKKTKINDRSAPMI